MKKFIILSTILSFVFVLFALSANAAKPSDYGLKDGELISAIFSDDPDVYIVNDSGYKRLFLNPTIFNFYGHLGGFFNVRLVSTEVRDAFITSGLFRDCETNDPKVYGVDIDGEDTGKLHWVNVSAENAVSEDSEFFKKVFCINSSEFKWYPKGSEFKAVKDVPEYGRMKEKEIVSTQERIAKNAETKNIGQSIICHYPPDNPTASQTIIVSASALKAHLDHGDVVGVCPSPSPFPSPTPPPTPTPTPTQTTTPSPTPTTPATTPEELKIISVVVTSTFNIMHFEWATNKPSISKVFISGAILSSKVYNSESGLSTRHIANVSGLTGNTNYSYQIESIADGVSVKKDGTYSTSAVKENATLKINVSSCTVNYNGTSCSLGVSYFEGGIIMNNNAITVSSDDNGVFSGGSNCTSGEVYTSAGQRRGNPITCPTGSNGIANFSYIPSTIGTRIITATANGVTATATTQGQAFIPNLNVPATLEITSSNSTKTSHPGASYASLAYFHVIPRNQSVEINRLKVTLNYPQYVTRLIIFKGNNSTVIAGTTLPQSENLIAPPYQSFILLQDIGGDIAIKGDISQYAPVGTKIIANIVGSNVKASDNNYESYFREMQTDITRGITEWPTNEGVTIVAE